jgi:flagellar biosynthesis/type III secretory pathway protein FliH
VVKCEKDKKMIDSNETIMYESGKDLGYQEGYDNCKEEMKEIIESMAYEIAEYRYPKQYAYNEDQIKSIMFEFGYTE